MADFYVFVATQSAWSSFISDTTVWTGARDATIGDEDNTLQVGAATEFTYTGIPAGSGAYNGPYDMHTFTLSTGGSAVWMAGVGNSGGIVVPLDATAYATFEAGTAFSISTNSTISSIAYSSFYSPPVNTDPTVSGVPSSVSATEDTATGIDLSGLSFADVDGDDLMVTVAASAGMLAASSGGGVTIGGSGTGTLTLSGSASAINSYLDTLSNVTYTGASNVNGTGAATLTVSASDGNGGSLASNPSIDVNITAVNDAPTVSGAPSSVSATEDTATGIDLSGLSFADVDGDDLMVTVAASAGTLAASSGGGVTIGGSGTGTLTLSGSASAINSYLDTLSNVTYTGASNVNGTGAATLTVSASDGNGGSLASNPSIDVNITAVNDAPTVSGAPSSVSATEDTATGIDLSGLSFADVDGDDLTVTVAASAGTLAASSGGGVTIGGSGTGTLTLSGSASAINSYLDTLSNVTYTGASNVNGTGAATLTVSASDGNGGSLASNPSIDVNITAVNDAPTVSGAPSSVSATEDTATGVDLSGLSFADVDGDDLMVTVAASAGTLAASSGGGVTIGGSGTGTLTLSGSASAINSYLDTLSNVTYTGASNVNGTGAATLTVSASDGNGGSLASNPSIDVNITAVNDAPTVSGAPSSVSATEDTATGVDLSGLSFADVDGNDLTVTVAASAGMLAASSGGGVTIGGSGTGTLTLSGSASAINSYLDTLSNVTYTGASNVNGTGAATLTVSASDGNGGSLASNPSIDVNITAVNDAPTVSGAPSSVSATEDTATGVDLSGLSFADVDGNDLTVTVAASAGTLAASSGGGVTIGGSGTGTLTLSGSASAINSYLDTLSNVTYTGASNVNGTGAATLTVSASDGNGGSLASNPSIDVNITAVNDAPTVSGAPSSVSATEDTATGIDLSGLSFADVDGDDLMVTVAASAGTLAASSGGGVTIGGSGTGTLTLSGSASAINSYLDTLSNVTYTGASNVNGTGAATLTVSASDGNGGSLASNPSIDVNITAVNDAPTVSGAPSSVSATEDTATGIDLSGLSFADVDGDDLTVTVAASAGTLAASSGGGVTIGGSGTGTLTLSGSASAINSYLDTLSNVTYTGASNVNGTGAATLTVSASDGNGGSLASNPSIDVNITAVNDAPTVSGAPSSVSATEDTATGVDLSGLSFADVDGDDLMVTVAASAGTLAASSGGGVTIGGSGTGTLTLSGSASAINSYLDTLSNVTYTGASNVNGTGAATLTVSASDGNGGSLASNPSIDVNITAVNDAPTVSGAPSSVSATEDTATGVDLSGLSFADVDGNDLTVTVAASAGMLAASSGGGVTIGGSGTGTLTLSGSASAINSYLDTLSNVTYTGASNVNGTGAATLTVSASDGNGGSLASNPSIDVNITAVNDAPRVSGAPSSVSATEDTATGIDLSGLSFADVDGDDLTVTVAASAGMLAASSGGGVTIGGSGTGTLTLSGSASAINSYLDTLSNVTYTGASNVNGTGAATLTVSASDGNGGSLASNPSIDVNITAVNDAPTVSGAPSSVSATEDTATGVDLSGLSFADVDGDDLMVTVAASAGTLAASSGGGVTIGGSGTGTLTLSGSASAINSYLDTLSNVTYTGASNVNGTGAATLTVSASDGNGGSLASNPSIDVNITAVNDAPTVSGAPSSVSATEDTATGVDLSGLSFADVDGDDLMVTVAASAGTLAASSGGGVTIGGSGTGTLTLSGSASAINSYLDTLSNVTYTGASNVNGTGAATLTVSASDGNGGSLASNPSIDVNITAVNDAPRVSGAPSSVSATEDTATGIDLSGLSFADVDGDDLTVTVAASAGMLAASSGGGVTIGGSGTGTLTLSGSASAINSYLDTLSNVTYTGASNVNGTGAATLTVSASDGNGGSLASNPSIDVNITAVNDAPIGVPTVEGTAELGEALSGSLPLDLDADGYDPADVSWQWLRDGAEISGATARNYVLAEDDIGTQVSLRARYVDDGGTSETITSSSTGKVRYGDLYLLGDETSDELRGRYGDDTILGRGGDDTLIGGAGSDILIGGAGSDRLEGWRGDDILKGRNGDDFLFGGTGDDTLRGNKGRDDLYGRAGDDTLYGGLGRDTLIGGKGDDLLTGGRAADVFVFARSTGSDTITDFETGKDLIEIRSGANKMGELAFSQVGDDVLIAFADSQILVENMELSVLKDAGHFLFI